jgi:hypothetical protein
VKAKNHSTNNKKAEAEKRNEKKSKMVAEQIEAKSNQSNLKKNNNWLVDCCGIKQTSGISMNSPRQKFREM